MTTPVEVSRQLSALTEKLYQNTRAYAEAEVEAAQLRCAYDLASARAFLQAAGTIPERDAHVQEAVAEIQLKARTSEAIVRGYKAKLRALQIDIDRLRTEAATVRAEMKTLGYGDGA